MFCTGGIRCEKASSYLLREGFENVYHLKGGILNYLEKIPTKNSLWSGECFVFDQRVALNHNLEKGEYSLCYACGMPVSKEQLLKPSYIKGVQCENCIDLYNKDDKLRFLTRQKQIDNRV